jgi:hypothetical protein
MERCSCWRFDIDPFQQEALENLANKLKDRAVVCYAAPAFHRISQLNAHSVKGTVVQNSTFPLARRLVNHKAWYYKGPGGSGVTNIDPEEVQGPSLEHLIERLAGEGRQFSTENAVAELKYLGNEIHQIATESISDNNPRKALYHEQLRQIERLVMEFELANEATRAFVRVVTFATAFNLEWYVI